MRVGVANACEEVNCGKETRRLDQKNSVEFVQLKVSSEIDNSIELKSDRGETDRTNRVCSVSFADSIMLLARGPQPPRVAVELSSGELLQTPSWPVISSRSSTTSKQERLTQPRMTRTATNFLHMARSSIQSWSLSTGAFGVWHLINLKLAFDREFVLQRNGFGFITAEARRERSGCGVPVPSRFRPDTFRSLQSLAVSFNFSSVGSRRYRNFTPSSG